MSIENLIIRREERRNKVRMIIEFNARMNAGIVEFKRIKELIAQFGRDIVKGAIESIKGAIVEADRLIIPLPTAN